MPREPSGRPDSKTCAPRLPFQTSTRAPARRSSRSTRPAARNRPRAGGSTGGGGEGSEGRAFLQDTRRASDITYGRSPYAQAADAPPRHVPARHLAAGLEMRRRLVLTADAGREAGGVTIRSRTSPFYPPRRAARARHVRAAAGARAPPESTDGGAGGWFARANGDARAPAARAARPRRAAWHGLCQHTGRNNAPRSRPRGRMGAPHVEEALRPLPGPPRPFLHATLRTITQRGNPIWDNNNSYSWCWAS